jgi:PAS domain S-box-containing protein
VDEKGLGAVEKTGEELNRGHLLAALFEALPVGICLTDEEGRYRFVNDAYCGLYDLSREEIIGQRFTVVMPPDQVAIAEAHYAQLLNGDMGIPSERRRRRSDGSVIFIEAANALLVGEDEQRLVVTIAKDITERKRVERALRERTRALDERVKELDCLYGIAALIEEPDVSLEDFLQGTVDLIPHAWQYPEATCARIIFEDREFRTRNFEQTRWKQSNELVVNGRPSGWVEVYYSEERPEGDEGTFLREERRLLSTIAEWLVKIVERMRAEEALRDSEERYRSVVENSHAGILIVDNAFRIVYGNEQLSQILGYPLEDIVGQGFPQFLDEGSRQLVIDRYLRRRRGEEIPSRYELDICRRDGEKRHVELSSTLLRDPSGDLYTVAQILDITERKRAEEELRAEKEFSESILNAVADTVFVFDPSTGEPLRWNRAFREVSGYTDEEIADRKAPDDWYNEEDLRRAVAATQEVLQAKQTTLEMSLLTKDGRAISTEYVGTILKDAEGNPRHLISVGRDITERKRAEEERRINEMRLNSLLELSQVAHRLSEQDIVQVAIEQAVSLTSSEIGYLHFVNPDERTIQLVTWSAKTMEQCTAVYDSHYPIDQAGVWADCIRFREPVVHNDYQSLPGKQGYPGGHAHLVRHASVPIFAEGKAALILGVGNKKTDYDESDLRQMLLIGDQLLRILRRKRMEEELKAALAEKEVLLREVHHRVKNNLQVISALLDFQADAVENEQAYRALRESQNRIQSMVRVHEQLYCSADLAQIAVADYIKSLVRDLSHSYGAYGLAFDIDAGDVGLNIEQAIPCGLIINELVSNAVKHAFPLGHGVPAGTESRISIVMQAENGKLRLVIGDNGIGLPPEIDLAQVRTLGLRLVNMLVRQLRGTLDMVIPECGGVTFVIEFPLSAERG